MSEQFKPDIEKTDFSAISEQTPSDTVLITNKIMDFAETTISNQLIDIRNLIALELKDTKREIEERVNEIKSVQTDIKFTRKTTLWLIAISAATLIVSIISTFFAR